MQTMVKVSGRKGEEIDLFAELAEGVLDRLAESKILEPIKLKMLKKVKRIFIKINQEEKDLSRNYQK